MRHQLLGVPAVVGLPVTRRSLLGRWPAAVWLLAALLGCGEPSRPAADPTGPAPSLTPSASPSPTPGAASGVDDCAPLGTCVPVAECGPTQGHLVHGHGCGAAHLACCSVGESSCGGKESWTCCKDGQEARPVCKDGGLTCLPGFVTGQTGACKK
jgi:hypothetical protein